MLKELSNPDGPYKVAYDIFRDPRSTQRDLIYASKVFWGYGVEGDRYQQARLAYSTNESPRATMTEQELRDALASDDPAVQQKAIEMIQGVAPAKLLLFKKHKKKVSLVTLLAAIGPLVSWI